MAVYVDRPDVRFQLNIQDSCTLCCYRGRDEDTKMYINSKGKAVRFDSEKAADELEAMQRSVQHLNDQLQKMVDQAKLDDARKDLILNDLNQRISEILAEAPPSSDSSVPTEITIGMLGRINEAIHDVFKNTKVN